MTSGLVNYLKYWLAIFKHATQIWLESNAFANAGSLAFFTLFSMARYNWDRQCHWLVLRSRRGTGHEVSAVWLTRDGPPERVHRCASAAQCFRLY